MEEMNKKTALAVFFAALLLLPLGGLSQEAIHWEGTLDSALRVAGKTDRLVLIHFWAPWCTYCKRLEAEVLANADVTAELAANYVTVKINADFFPATAKQYGVTALPTTVIVSPQGQLIDSIRGYVKPSDYVARLHSVALRAKPSGALYAQIPAGAAPPPANPPGPPERSPAAGPAPGQSPAEQPAIAGGPATSVGTQPTDVPTQPAYGSQPPDGGQWPPGLVPPPGYAPQPPRAGPAAASPALVSPNNPSPYGSPAASGGYGPAVAAGGSPATGPASATPASGPTVAGQSSNPPAAAPAFAPNATGPASATPAAQPTSPPAPGPVVTIPPGNPPLGLDGYCPVSLAEKYHWVPGDRRWGAIHRGRTYLFAGPEEQRRFLADPDRYAPLFSGNDIVLAVDLGQVVPGMRQHGIFLLPSGRVFLFASEETLEKFKREPARYGQQALASLRAGMNPGAVVR
jgi:protein disulfide-isomerase